MKRLFFTLILCVFSFSAQALELPTPLKNHRITGGKGVKLAVQEWGNPKGKPVLFAHAWSQSHLGWLPQINGALAEKYRLITFDQRGHGNSEKPLTADQYNNPDVWADDMRAIIKTLALKDVTLVGWSYGSLVIGDYLSKYGADNIHALNIVGGLTALGVKRVENYFGEGAARSAKAWETDLSVQSAAMTDVADMMLPETTDKHTYGLIIATNMFTPAFVRKAMTNRSEDYQSLYEGLNIPVLFTHGTKDTGILPISAIEGAAFAPKGEASLYEGANHGPHWHSPERFNKELSDLIDG